MESKNAKKDLPGNAGPERENQGIEIKQ